MTPQEMAHKSWESRTAGKTPEQISAMMKRTVKARLDKQKKRRAAKKRG